MARRDLIVIAASAGGIEALQAVLRSVPADLPATILVVLHIPAEGGRVLPQILDRAGPLVASAAVHGEELRHGHVLVAPGDHHLLVAEGHVHLSRGPRENGSRPAADPLFRSAATYYGARVIGVVLSGSLSDGTAGLGEIRRRGGIAVVQDPADALYDGMPTSALDHVGADHVLPAREIGALLGRLVDDEVAEDAAPAPSETVLAEVALMERDGRVLDENHPGTPSQWPCPDCSGVLWEIDDSSLLRFRCRVGHAWSAENLTQVQSHAIESALWMALRALEDRAALARVLAERAQRTRREISAGRHLADVDDLDRSIAVLRSLLRDGSQPAAGH